MKWCKHRGCCRRLTPTLRTSNTSGKVELLSTSVSQRTSVPERTLVIPSTSGRNRPEANAASVKGPASAAFADSLPPLSERLVGFVICNFLAIRSYC